MSFDANASDEACRCPRCGSYRPCYPFGSDDPCLECRDRARRTVDVLARERARDEEEK